MSGKRSITENFFQKSLFCGYRIAMKILKCAVVGDGMVGKTTLLVSYMANKFAYEHTPTVLDNFTVKVKVDEELCTIRFFDTAGQDAYDRLRPLGTRCIYSSF